MDKTQHNNKSVDLLVSTSNLETSPQAALINEQELMFSNIIADLVEQWGFKRLLGKVWALLYLRKTALSPIQIQEAFAISAGNVNTILKELQQWGVAKRVKVPSDRKYYYKVDEHLWRSIANVFKARELRILDDAIEGLDTLEAQLKQKNTYQASQVEHVSKTLQIAYQFSNLAVNAPIDKMSKLTTLVKILRNL
ncbi:MAG TPA: hypothetical protein PKC21_01695 [Oligoflexia bacterium]|nr:hypothetical protein [Oligoflexia bacterium]HMR24045.1 hypothetical protein [Oligoflexia bacterium]